MRRLTFFLTLLFSAALSVPGFSQTPKADSLVAVLKTELPDTERVNTLNRLSNELRFADPEKSEKYAKESIDLATKIDFRKGLAMAYGTYGVTIGDQGALEEEIEYHEKSLAIHRELGDKKSQAKELNNLAVCEYLLGSFKEAVDHALQSVQLYEDVGDKWGMAVAYMSLGNIAIEQKDFAQAENYYNLGLKANQESRKDAHLEARLLGNMGNVYNAKGEYEKSFSYYTRTLAVFEKDSLMHEMGIIYNNMGTVLQKQERTAEGLVYFRKSLAIRMQLSDSDGVCTAYQNMGSALSDLGKSDSALYYISEALRMARRMNSKAQEVSAYRAYADAYATIGNYGEAYKYLEKYVALNDSLLGSENESAINDLKTKYAEQKHARREEQMQNESKIEKERSQRNIMLLLVVLLGVALVAFVFYNRTRRKQLVNEQLERKNMEITLQKNAITDSINYAKKIQDSILPPESLVKKILPDSFVLYIPKDVVSGDFYWMEQKDGKSVFAAVDCTGHGVPGALMSVVGFNLLNQAVNEMGITKPSDILHHLDYGVNKLLRQSDGGDSVKDGMDLALCTLDPQTRKLQYAGVFNPAYIIHKGELLQLKPDKYPIGINTDGVTDDYTNHEHQLEAGDMIYLFSDGYADQFGGPNGKKFMYRRFRDLLLGIHEFSTAEQKEKLAENFHDWRGVHEQVDDIIVIGVRVN
jgi:serine phosphatase RsbU (regulator of sigma subunit)/tetratricopeptide (TPR) repeat protein